MQRPASNVSTFLHDAIRFVERFESIIDEAPSQVHCSALVFAPETSIIRQSFEDKVTQGAEMLSPREADWGSCSSTSESHSDWVRAVAFTPDGQLIASVSHDKTIRLWESATGMCRITLDGHSDWVTAVAFSPDGALVASASADKSVRIWETATGTCCKILQGHSWNVTAVGFSPDGRMLHSTRGELSLSHASVATPLPSSPQQQSSNLLVQDNWILRNQQQFLLLPPEYQPMSTAIYKDIVCLGFASGRVVLLRIP